MIVNQILFEMRVSTILFKGSTDNTMDRFETPNFVTN